MRVGGSVGVGPVRVGGSTDGDGCVAQGCGGLVLLVLVVAVAGWFFRGAWQVGTWVGYRLWPFLAGGVLVTVAVGLAPLSPASKARVFWGLTVATLISQAAWIAFGMR